MNLHIGVKSDPVEYRYSYEWLFRLLREEGISRLQMGSSFEFYLADDAYFREIKDTARTYDVEIRSCFTAHRELGGAFTGNPHLHRVAEKAYARYIEIGALLGATYVGSNPGAIYRDNPDEKAAGTRRYLEMMVRLMKLAAQKGLKGLTIEPMSCGAEPPSTPDEIDHYLSFLSSSHGNDPKGTVPAYLCGDISHGVASAEGNVVYDNMELFELEIPWMAEFHFKNTDAIFNSTFGFSKEEQRRGIVDLYAVKDAISRNVDRWPVDDVTGYLEIGGPKLGRDYSDRELRRQLVESISELKKVFGTS